MEIALFQLENLVVARAPFCFLDLREGDKAEVPEPLKAILRLAHAVPAKDVSAYLDREKIPKDRPIVLICSDGCASQKVSEDLEAASYRNVYVVARGVLGLLSEL